MLLFMYNRLTNKIINDGMQDYNILASYIEHVLEGESLDCQRVAFSVWPQQDSCVCGEA